MYSSTLAQIECEIQKEVKSMEWNTYIEMRIFTRGSASETQATILLYNKKEYPNIHRDCSLMKSRPAARYQVDDATKRLGDTKPNPHGGEDDLSSSQTAAIL